ncbi:MAG: hypothetical protein PHX83_07935 [Acidobacteriia bacterium]|nr:hypothetical protein [Terriglobia bacterium]
MDPIQNLKAFGFEISSPDPAGWYRAERQGCAILFRANAGRVEIFRSAGLVRKGKIFRLLDRGFQKFLSDDSVEIPALADMLEHINDFYQDFKDAVGLPVLFNEALGALTAFTDLDSAEHPYQPSAVSFQPSAFSYKP